MSQDKDPEVRIIQSEAYRESYANSVQVRMSVWDFQLNFGTMQQTENQLTLTNFQGIYLSPQQAKALAAVLTQNVAQYEAPSAKSRSSRSPTPARRWCRSPRWRPGQLTTNNIVILSGIWRAFCAKWSRRTCVSLRRAGAVNREPQDLNVATHSNRELHRSPRQHQSSAPQARICSPAPENPASPAQTPAPASPRWPHPQTARCPCGFSTRSSSCWSTSRISPCCACLVLDEAGYYIPAALDFYRTGSLIPHSTLTNAHPPLPSILLGWWWHLSGYHIAATRTFLAMIAAAALLGVFRLVRLLLDTPAAIAVTLLTAIYPVWFAQSTMAHADLFARPSPSGR